LGPDVDPYEGLVPRLGVIDIDRLRANLQVFRRSLRTALIQDEVRPRWSTSFRFCRLCRVHADVFIDRPPADVWRFLLNSAAYPDWNPFITRVEGDFREGATIRIVLGTGSDATVFEPTVLLVRPDQDLCWRGSVWVRGLFDGKQCIHLTAIAGSTHLQQTERFSGLFVGWLTKDVIEDTRRNFQAMNAAVKQQVESKTP
jgi:hypothetical protein